MSLLISTAYAADGAASQSASLLQFLPMVVVVIVFYFFMIRPQSKRAKEHRAMVDSLGVGSEVVFAGGLMGKVKKSEGDYAVITIGTGVDIKIQKSAITAVLPEGTLASL